MWFLVAQLPAEPINGAMVSNFYQKEGNASPDWTASATVHPPELCEKLKSLRFHLRADRIDAAALREKGS